MNKTTKTLIVSAIAIPIALTSAGSAAAMEPLFGSGILNTQPVHQSRYQGIKRGIKLGEGIKLAIERGDYAAFRQYTESLPDDAPVRSFTAAEFAELQRMHQLFQKGQTAEAKAIATKLQLAHESDARAQ